VGGGAETVEDGVDAALADTVAMGHRSQAGDDPGLAPLADEVRRRPYRSQWRADQTWEGDWPLPGAEVDPLDDWGAAGITSRIWGSAAVQTAPDRGQADLAGADAMVGDQEWDDEAGRVIAGPEDSELPWTAGERPTRRTRRWSPGEGGL
jgi:hypothetical protein